ncbi:MULTISPECIES: DUF4391 domain-containing protein [Emticicia]|uniref:DUF4391 domain-containing protein n=1 Tax=Emticicia TaxID=312278 RepID=UPI0007D89AE6|nr:MULTISPECIES: DUF4391 domain-containing protein [Emticicia]
MIIFELPQSTFVNRVIPKNAFDSFTNQKQKRIFIDDIDKIKWVNKIAKDTVNLEGKDVQEIQVFDIQLKKADNIKDIVEVIDKAIPYQIVFILTFGKELMISTSKKHFHPTIEDKSIIDWTFSTNWFSLTEQKYQFNLKQSLDFVYADFCQQLTDTKQENKSIDEIVQFNAQIRDLERQIQQLENKIKKEKQFNLRLTLHLELQELKERLLKLGV